MDGKGKFNCCFLPSIHFLSFSLYTLLYFALPTGRRREKNKVGGEQENRRLLSLSPGQSEVTAEQEPLLIHKSKSVPLVFGNIKESRYIDMGIPQPNHSLTWRGKGNRSCFFLGYLYVV